MVIISYPDWKLQNKKGERAHFILYNTSLRWQFFLSFFCISLMATAIYRELLPSKFTRELSFKKAECLIFLSGKNKQQQCTIFVPPTLDCVNMRVYLAPFQTSFSFQLLSLHCCLQFPTVAPSFPMTQHNEGLFLEPK